MAYTTPKARKLAARRVRPADVLLFSPYGRRARWSNVDHAAIAIGNGLMIQSSNEGVTLTVWAYGHYAHTFAFGKSVLPG
jgi:cell wall-associated NlpC family hydrolase